VPERIRVDGVDYTPEGINALREELIGFRTEAYKQLPDAAGVIIVLTHAIALLADYAEMREAEDAARTG